LKDSGITLKRRDIASALRSKGFQEQSIKGHYHYILIIDERKTNIRTEMSSGSNSADTPEWLISKMYKQLKMKNAAEFKNYIDCKYKFETYKRFLNDHGLI